MAMTMKELVERLAQDEEFREQFSADKTAVMTEMGVSEEDQAAVMSGDPDQVAARLGHQHVEDNEYNFAWFF
ncbi:MAG: hypothetical protein ACR2P0_09610 [Acidimicrobiales bacterium]